MTENEKPKSSKNTLGCGIGGLIGAYALAMIAAIIIPPIHKKYVIDKNIERGYANPSKLEITTQDLNENGKYEVDLEYNGKSYAIMLDTQGKPSLREYEVKTVQPVKPEIVYK